MHFSDPEPEVSKLVFEGTEDFVEEKNDKTEQIIEEKIEDDATK